MGRLIDLSTRTARKRLKPRAAPYWFRIARGRALGYRISTGATAGSWQVRVRVGGDQGSPYRQKVLGAADDLPHVSADRESVLTYAQAVEAAAAWDPAANPELRTVMVTVAEVCRAYCAWAQEHRPRSAKEIGYAMRAHVLSALGDVKVSELTTERIRRWHQDLASTPARTRSPKGKQRYRKATTADQQRARRATANRILIKLKAALNRAWRDGTIDVNDSVWRRAEPFRGVDRPRDRYLEEDEIPRLLDAIAEPGFRDLVAGALYTGARYQELARLRVGDLVVGGGLRIRQSKSDKPRTVYLNEEGERFFAQLATGRASGDLLFSRAGAAWKKSDQQHRMRRACDTAGIAPRVTFHELRHTYASHYLMRGGSLSELAKQLGHSTTGMVDLHYGHLAEGWRRAGAQKHAPSLEGNSGPRAAEAVRPDGRTTGNTAQAANA